MRCAVAALAGFAVAAVITSLGWWALAPEPDPRLATEVVTRLDPGADVNEVEVAEVDAMHTGAKLLDVSVEGFDTATATQRAREIGWTVADEGDDVTVDTDSASLRMRSPTRLTLDPHGSVWPGLAMAAGGTLGLLLCVGLTRARLGRSSTSWRLRGAVAWTLLLPMVSLAGAVLGVLALGVPGRPDAAAAAFGAILLTWWALVPIGIVLGVLAWVSYGATDSEALDPSG